MNIEEKIKIRKILESHKVCRYADMNTGNWFANEDLVVELTTLLQQEREKAVREVVSFLDELEIRQPDYVKTDNWRWWKYIRNNIRDQFLKESEKQ